MSQVTITNVAEGDSHLIKRIDFLSDGVGGELEHYVVISPTDLNPSRPNTATAFRIMQIWSGLVYFDVTFGFGTLAPRQCWTTTRDHAAHVDFRCFGGLMDYATAPPSDVDGKLWISTNGFAPVGSRGTVVLELRKTNSASANAGGV